uniref:Trafficking protein particle complex subunit 14 n=1 Tax=Terrapene triunguis TaxID=2587831 RepID=A0A674JVC5_9SAUR
MEAQCDYFMYFPAVPFPARELLRGEPGRYRALPRRNHLYLGETVRFLLVLRGRPGPGGARTPWGELGSSLAALASVSPGGVDPGGEGDGEPPEELGGDGDSPPPPPGSFRDCRPLLTHGQGPLGRPAAGVRGGRGALGGWGLWGGCEGNPGGGGRWVRSKGHSWWGALLCGVERGEPRSSGAGARGGYWVLRVRSEDQRGVCGAGELWGRSEGHLGGHRGLWVGGHCGTDGSPQSPPDTCGGADCLHGRGHFPADDFPGQPAPRDRQGQDRGDSVEAGAGGAGGAGTRVPEPAAEPGAGPALPRGAGGLQSPSEHHADRAAPSRAEMPPAERLREIPHRAQGAERLLPGGNLPVGCPHPAQLQRQLPAHAARRLRAAGRRRLPSLGRGACRRLLPHGRRRLRLPLRPERPRGAELPLPAAGARAAPGGHQGGSGGPPGGCGSVVDTQTPLHQQHLHPLQAAQHPAGPAAVRDDGCLRVARIPAPTLHRHLHPAQQPAGLLGRAAGLDPGERHGGWAGLQGPGGVVWARPQLVGMG